MFRNHLNMIGSNEPVQKKAKFWQSYVRALKGTDDMRAPLRAAEDLHHPTWPSLKYIYDDPSERINYRYYPLSQETYTLSPRKIY